MSAVTVGHMACSSGPEHASAVRRLAEARDRQSRLGAAVAGSRAEPLAQERLSAGRAYVASREAWLHWIEEAESLAPWADGEWAPKTPMLTEDVPSEMLDNEHYADQLVERMGWALEDAEQHEQATHA